MDETFGIVADAARVKNFVKAVINSNQRHEVWNEKHKDEIQMGKKLARNKIPVCIWGPHGIGKTQLLKALAEELTAEEERSPEEKWLFTNIAPAQFEEMGDLLGMPSIDPGKLDDPSDDKTIMVPPDWTPQKVEEKRLDDTGKNGPGIFLIDDVNRADIRIINGIMQLLQDFEMASWKMPEGWHMVLTANPPGEDYIVREFDDAMMTRMMHIEMRYDENVWARWAEGQGIDPRGISFVLAYPELMTGKRTTPRTLVQFFEAIENISDLKDPENSELVNIIGRSCLEAETVAEFIQFVRNNWSMIIQPEEILNSKKFKEIENRFDKLVLPKKKKEVKRVDIANIITQRLVNRVYVTEEVINKKQRDNIVSYLKIKSMPLDMRVAAGRDLYNFALRKTDKETSDAKKKNKKSMTTVFEDPELAKNIIQRM